MSSYPTNGPPRHRSTRSRSRSPHRVRDDRIDRHGSNRRSRSHSTHRKHEDHHRNKRRRSRSPPKKTITRPFNAPKLHKHDFETYMPLFASYLDIQKQKYLEDLDEREVRGRWKSFTGKWNNGELAEGWYDPVTLQKAQQAAPSAPQPPPPERRPRRSPNYGNSDDDDDDDDFGPAPPPHIAHSRRTGPTIPREEDLQLRNELRSEDAARKRANYIDDLGYTRRVDRKEQKERLEELVPRADPGSRERQLEKKQETTSTLQGFREAKEGGEAEVNEADLMGDDSIEGYKKQKKDMEKKKSEREIRREEIMRARAEEREERLAGRRAKEEQTMDFLKSLAKERFG